MNGIEPHCVWPLGARLGEGPIWQASDCAVYFVDIKGRRIHRWSVDSGRRDSWPTPGQPGFLAPVDDDRFVCGLNDGLYFFEPSRPASHRFTPLVEVEPQLPGNRLNDGYVDIQGRLWFGSMDDSELEQTGALYSLADGVGLASHDAGYVITNGPAMSPDGRTLYHTDTLARCVYAFDVGDDGNLAHKRTFLQIEPDGYPDGMAVDAAGCLWVAMFGGWRIDRFSPQGEYLESVRFPCANITKLAFGGDDLRTVFVTTATKGLSPDDLRRQPLAGGLFSFHSPISGLPQNRLHPRMTA